jgi:hypothetical protein
MPSALCARQRSTHRPSAAGNGRRWVAEDWAPSLRTKTLRPAVSQPAAAQKGERRWSRRAWSLNRRCFLRRPTTGRHACASGAAWQNTTRQRGQRPGARAGEGGPRAAPPRPRHTLTGPPAALDAGREGAGVSRPSRRGLPRSRHTPACAPGGRRPRPSPPWLWRQVAAPPCPPGGEPPVPQRTMGARHSPGVLARTSPLATGSRHAVMGHGVQGLSQGHPRGRWTIIQEGRELAPTQRWPGVPSCVLVGWALYPISPPLRNPCMYMSRWRHFS